VLGPARSRNIVMAAAALSITAAMTQTDVMRDPPSLLAGKSCAIRLRFSLTSHVVASLSADGRQSASRSNVATNNRSTLATWR
jgi:hypothetical protein